MWRQLWERYRTLVLGVGILLVILLGWYSAEQEGEPSSPTTQVVEEARPVVFHSPGGEVKKMLRTEVLASPFFVAPKVVMPEKQSHLPTVLPEAKASRYEPLQPVCLGTMQGDTGGMAIVEYDGEFRTLAIGESVGNWRLTGVDQDETWWTGNGETIMIRRKRE